jgi:hypothetical protein
LLTFVIISALQAQDPFNVLDRSIQIKILKMESEKLKWQYKNIITSGKVIQITYVLKKATQNQINLLTDWALCCREFQIRHIDKRNNKFIGKCFDPKILNLPKNKWIKAKIKPFLLNIRRLEAWVKAGDDRKLRWYRIDNLLRKIKHNLKKTGRKVFIIKITITDIDKKRSKINLRLAHDVNDFIINNNNQFSKLKKPNKVDFVWLSYFNKDGQLNGQVILKTNEHISKKNHNADIFNIQNLNLFKKNKSYYGIAVTSK